MVQSVVVGSPVVTPFWPLIDVDFSKNLVSGFRVIIPSRCSRDRYSGRESRICLA